jgi:Na+-transporting methylmalonyl-CoA/oxaloacetate decarboxylase beta subunit
LPHDLAHLVLLQLVQEITLHALVEHQHRKVHIVRKVHQVEHPVVLVVLAADLIVVPAAEALLAHLERMPANLQSVSKSLVKLYAMNSTICKHQNWVAQLFLTEMVQPKFECDAVHRWQISQRELAQIQQL